MKKQPLINLTIIGICLTGFAYLINVNREQAEELAKKEKEVLKLWDDKISEHQFMVNVTYRDADSLKDFFDKLDSAYDKMRGLLHENELTEIDKKQLTDFIMNDFTQTAGMKKEEVFNRLAVEDIDQVFAGNNLEIVKKLENLFNPSFMTSRFYFHDFDIWEKKEEWDLSAGDTTTFMIRLLRNYDLHSHQMELIPSVDLKVTEPYLGELQVIIPKDAKKGELQKFTFQIYDWINRDTIVQEIHIHPN